MDLIFYNRKHSVTFGDKNSWDDWHLIPTSKPIINPPSVKTKQVDIPGANGLIDLTTVLTGYPTYGNRTGSLEFILAPGYWYWENAKTAIMEYLGGKVMNLYLDDDPDHYYTGMFYVNGLKSDARMNGITINYDLYPFKRDLIASDEEWLWDPFNFETGRIVDLSSITVTTTATVRIEDCFEPMAPIFTSNAMMALTHKYYAVDGYTEKTKNYIIEPGSGNPGLAMKPGTNTLTFLNTAQTITNEINKLHLNGNVDLKNRPQVSAETMHRAGYSDFDDDSYATLYSMTYTWDVWQNGAEVTKATLLFTPIKTNGTVLSQEQIDNYVYGLFDTVQSYTGFKAADTNGLLIHVLQGEQISKMDDIAIKAHDLSDAWETKPATGTVSIYYRGGHL